LKQSHIGVTGQQTIDACIHCGERCWPSCHHCRYKGNFCMGIADWNWL